MTNLANAPIFFASGRAGGRWTRLHKPPAQQNHPQHHHSNTTATMLKLVVTCALVAIASALPRALQSNMPSGNACAANPCQNGGVCEAIALSRYSCMCQVGFVGMNCEIMGGRPMPTPAPAPKQDCPPGTISSDGHCVDCQAGTYQPMAGQTQCLTCLPGMYSDVSGSMMCNVCPAMSYTSYTGSTSCTRCAQGTTSATGSTACTRDNSNMPSGNACAANPCQNGGVCEAIALSRYSCMCQVGFVGMNCEIRGH
jgi:hypothetical protein